MPRILFEKKGQAIWISHLDLMRLFQRAFKRAGLPLTHTHGFNPRPSVSIALPLSVGIESECELLDFTLDGVVHSNEEIKHLLNQQLVDGIRVKDIYDNGRKIRDLSLLRCRIDLEYDQGAPDGTVSALEALFQRNELILPKKAKNGIVDQDILPMIRQLQFTQTDPCTVTADCLICCQNPALNPSQISLAITTFLPQYAPSFSRCQRLEVYDGEQTIFR